MIAAQSTFYVTGGTLRPDAPCYVERDADREVFNGLLNGEFCYVLTSRQMGKSSLMARTTRRLRETSVRVVIIDLTAVGLNLTPEQWYNGLATNIGRQFGVEDELDSFWQNNGGLGPAQRFFDAIREVVLKQDDKPVVIFVDEIDTVRSLPFSTDEFFAAIRECYNRRTEEKDFNKLTFCLLGVATPFDLIRDTSTTPFQVGTQIELTDFKGQQAAPLAHGFGLDEGRARALLDRILYWTNGHPYLTQRLCRATAEANTEATGAPARIQNSKSIDRLCEDLFLSNRAREKDDNLLFVRERLLRSEVDLAGLLTLYDRIRNFERVRDDEADSLITVLHLSGITRVDRGCLRVRNRIYERVFDHDWVMANMPVLRSSGATAIGVLPFVNGGGDPLDEYWSDGLTEELINALGHISGLRVASRSSAFRFKGNTENVREIAARLNVEVVLEGIVRRLGSRIRIWVELVSAADGYRLWAEVFNYRARDLFEIQDEITAAIVTRLKFGLRKQTDVHVVKPPTKDPEAYNLYLKGRYHWNKRQEDAVHRSLGFFEEAIKKDPDFGLAYAGLADAYSILGTYSYLRPVEVYPKAKAAALEALKVDDQLAHAHAALGCVLSIYDWDWIRAEAEFKRAIQLNPSYATAHQWYAINCLTPLGRHEESISELRTAQAVDPLSLSNQASLALAFYCARQYEQAIEQCRLTWEMEESFWVTHLFLAWAYGQMGLPEKAVAAATRARQLGRDDPVSVATLAQAQALAGNRNEATRLLEELVSLSQSRYVPAGEMAFVHLALGETGQSMEWLRKAIEEKSLSLIYLGVDSRLDALRTDSRFSELLVTVGLRT